MLAILGIISTSLSALSSVMSIAKVIKTWHKPAGYLIRFINWIGGMVDWVIAQIDAFDAWTVRVKVKLGLKQARIIEVKKEKKAERKRRRRVGRKPWRRWGRWRG